MPSLPFELPRSLTSIKARILGILGLLAVGYLLQLAMIQFTAAANHDRLQQVSSALFPAALRLQEAEASFEHLEGRYKDAILLEDPNLLAESERDADQVEASLRALRTLITAAPEFIVETDALLSEFESIRSRSHLTYTALLNTKENIDPTLQAQTAALANDDKQLAVSMHTLDQAIADRFRDQLSIIEAWSQRSSFAGWVVFSIALLGCVFAWRVLEYKVFQALERLARRMQAIAEGDGDLTDRVEIRGHDELDEVGLWFNVFIERVEQIVVRVTHNAQALADSARSLAETARETATHTALQQEQAMRITSSMGDISTAVGDISHTTQRAAADARKAEANARTGGDTIHSTVVTMQALLAHKQANAARVEQLGDSSLAIGKVVSVIEDIANQTSLLALNASIESARAGEHGRGFAVVAAEVGRLAERTSKATRQIDLTVRAIQEGTAEVVEAMRSGLRQVQVGVSSAQAAGTVLSSIIQGSEAMQLMVTQIAGASSEQSSATRSVNDNLNEIASIAIQTTLSSTRAAESCDRLSALADDLNQLVGAFKVRATPISP